MLILGYPRFSPSLVKASLGWVKFIFRSVIHNIYLLAQIRFIRHGNIIFYVEFRLVYAISNDGEY